MSGTVKQNDWPRSDRRPRRRRDRPAWPDAPKPTWPKSDPDPEIVKPKEKVG